jgi:hypothetical protein
MKTIINPYGIMFYQYNKLYRHTFNRMFKTFFEINKPCSIKSGCKNESPDRNKKDDNDIPPGGNEICNHLTRYDVTSTRDNNWQRKQI